MEGFMNLKKTVTGIFVSTLVFGIVATTAIAENYNVNKYNKSYNYSQTQKDMHYTFSGNSNQAITSASNITRNSSRYISTYVAKKSRKNDSVITSDSDNIMTTNAGVYSAISRNQTELKKQKEFVKYLSEMAPIYFVYGKHENDANEQIQEEL